MKLLRLEFFKCRRRKILLVCAAVLAAELLWIVSSFFRQDAKDLVQGWMMMLYDLSLVDAIIMPISVATIASRNCELEHKGTTLKLLETMATPGRLYGAKLTWGALVLPAVTLSANSLAMITRMTRSSMLETIRQDYIRTARAKGVPQRTIVFKHALRNALLPIITIMATSFGGLLGGAVITESVFSIPGLGTLIVTGIRQRDKPVVLAAILFLAVMFSIIMLVVDLLYAFVDPRIKAKYSK